MGIFFGLLFVAVALYDGLTRVANAIIIYSNAVKK